MRPNDNGSATEIEDSCKGTIGAVAAAIVVVLPIRVCNSAAIDLWFLLYQPSLPSAVQRGGLALYFHSLNLGRALGQ